MYGTRRARESADQGPAGRYHRRDVSVPQGHDGNKASGSCATVETYHAVDAPRTSARKHTVADTRCFLNVSRGSGRREKRRCSCSAASTSAVGWEAPVRTRSIICFGDWKTPESLQAVKLTAQQDRQRNSHRDTAIRNAKRSANTEIPTYD